MRSGNGYRFVAAVSGSVVAGAVLLVLLMAPGCDQAPGNPGNPGTPGPVTVGKAADNSHCLVCHLDFKTELLTAQHEKAGIGCTTCHGESLAHGDDEFNIITPDVSFGRAEIDPFCKTCHQAKKDSQVYAAFLKKWRDKRRPNGRIISEESVCTDCHGNHAVLSPDKLMEATAPR